MSTITIITAPSDGYRWVAKDATEVAHFSQPGQGHKIEVYTRAALTQGAGEAVEPVAWMDDGQSVRVGSIDAGTDFRVVTPRSKATMHASTAAAFSTPLYLAPPAQQLQQAIRDYHYALDTRQPGDAAERRAFGAICDHLGMHWQQGQEAATRLKGTHD